MYRYFTAVAAVLKQRVERGLMRAWKEIEPLPNPPDYVSPPTFKEKWSEGLKMWQEVWALPFAEKTALIRQAIRETNQDYKETWTGEYIDPWTKQKMKEEAEAARKEEEEDTFSEDVKFLGKAAGS